MAAQDDWQPVPPLTEDEMNRRDYPSIDLAYAIAVQSYDTAQKRREGADTRLQTLLTFTNLETGRQKLPLEGLYRVVDALQMDIKDPIP
jgi:hypothetical protein